MRILILLSFLLIPSTIHCESLYQYVAKIYAPSIDGENAGIGTAFAINKDILMTAKHVCEAVEDEIILLGSDNKGMEYKLSKDTGRIVFMDDKLDICLIRLHNHGLKTVEFAGPHVKIRTGDIIRHIGAPKGMFPVLRKGFVVKNDRQYIVISTPVYPGASGSPLFRNGKVIGVVIKKFTAFQGGIAVKIPNRIKSFQ